MRKLVVLNNVPCILAALFLLSFAFSCSSGRGGEAMEIEVVPAAGVLHFSDLYDGCGAVVPQGPMLRGIVDVEIVDSTIIVLGDTDSGMVSLYTMDGEYLYSFLQAGRGPEEMTDVSQAVKFFRKKFAQSEFLLSLRSDSGCGAVG